MSKEPKVVANSEVALGFLGAPMTGGDQCDQAPNEDTETVGQSLDVKILRTRKQLEELCIVKAKAETAGLLDFPAQFIRQVAWC